MSIFNKVMASAFGVGAAKIDTIVNTKNLMPGSKIEGVCKINGGKIEQYINDITIGVYTSYKKDVNDKTVTEIERIQEHTININKQIFPGESYEVNFSFILYKRVPVTIHKSKVWLSTNLDIEAGVDCADRDYLKIDCNEYMENTINAISNLGFNLREVENEYCSKRLNGLKFVQEFEFVPTLGRFRGRLDELELVFIPTNTHVDILLEVDRKARGLMSFISESLDLDETKLKIRLENSRKYSYAEIKSIIEELLIKHS